MGFVRPYGGADLADVRNVCLRTAATGSDATGLYSNDDLLPDIWALPYLAFQPDLAFVVEHDGRVCGYVLGVRDTREFVRWFRDEWAPKLLRKYEQVDPPVTDEDRTIHFGFRPERMLVPELDDYPAHLHIDLLPEISGRGLGRALIERLSTELRDRSVPGLHLMMDPANTGARAFYDRLGFAELPSSSPEEPVLGIRL